MNTGFKAVSLLVLMAVAFLWESVGHAQMHEVALERTVRDDDRAVRAIIRYRPEVLTGGQDEVVNEDGSVSLLHWDAFLGQFEAELIEGSLSGQEAEDFLREAVLAVCPSADTAEVQHAWVQASGPFLRLFAQCPSVDARN